jgi:hypothetical protein
MANAAEAERKESFDVVLLKEGVNPMEAKPDDYKRVPVQATSTLAAQMLDEAQVAGYRPVNATPPGYTTDDEVMARQRELNGPPVDKSKL